MVISRLPYSERCVSISVSMPGRYVDYLRDHNLSVSDLIRRAIEVQRSRELSRVITPPLLLIMLSYLLFVLSPVLLVGAAGWLTMGFALCVLVVGSLMLCWALWQQLRISKYTSDMPILR